MPEITEIEHWFNAGVASLADPKRFAPPPPNDWLQLKAFTAGAAHVIKNRIGLRDYFAGCVLTGLCSRENLPNLQDAATDAYALADALLGARGPERN
jgi:hypothetical protein